MSQNWWPGDAQQPLCEMGRKRILLFSQHPVVSNKQQHTGKSEVSLQNKSQMFKTLSQLLWPF